MTSSNAGVVEGFRPFKQKGPRKSRESLKYQHVGDPAGRTWLIFVILTAEQLLGQSTACLASRDFRGSGVSDERLHRLVSQRCPEYAAHYESKSGRKLTKNVTYQRFHKKLVYSNGPGGTRGKPTFSSEHYFSSRSLRRVLPAVERAFRENPLPLSLSEMQRLGAYL